MNELNNIDDVEKRRNITSLWAKYWTLKIKYRKSTYCAWTCSTPWKTTGRGAAAAITRMHRNPDATPFTPQYIWGGEKNDNIFYRKSRREFRRIARITRGIGYNKRLNLYHGALLESLQRRILPAHRLYAGIRVHVGFKKVFIFFIPRPISVTRRRICVHNATTARAPERVIITTT